MTNEIKSGSNNILSTDINVITAEINAYQRVAGEAIFEIGRRLKHVKENDLSHGEFGKWLETVSMKPRQAQRFMKVFERFGKATPVTYFELGMSVLYELADFTDEELDQTYELPGGESKKPTEMSRREIEDLKANVRKAEQQAEDERKERERLEIENEELANREPEVVTEYVEKETKEPYDRTLDEPYLVERSRDFYEMLNEVDGLYRKYAHLSNSIEELRDLAYYDDDAKQKYWKADEFWRNLREIFKEGNSNIIDAEII